MILNGINNYCATSEMKKQMGTLTSDDIDCSSKTSFTEEEIKKMVNLGNAKVKSSSYSGNKLTNLVIESNGHEYKLCSSGTFAIDDEVCQDNIALEGVSLKSVAESLVYENNVCKSEGTYQYMGGCYLKSNVIQVPDTYGENEHPRTNYIWYSGFLWRIMGINADGTVRMITEEDITAISLGASSTAENWDESYVKEWLNDYFYNHLKGNNIITEQIWCSETTTSSSSARTTCTNNLSVAKAKVGLITLDEYNLAGGQESYLDIKQHHWTMTPKSSSNAWYVNNDGDAITDYSIGNGVRAVINVNSDVIITEGNGTWSSPYEI